MYARASIERDWGKIMLSPGMLKYMHMCAHENHAMHRKSAQRAQSKFLKDT